MDKPVDNVLESEWTLVRNLGTTCAVTDPVGSDLATDLRLFIVVDLEGR